MHQPLIDLLRHRETIIADHAWRDHDPAGHFDALKEVSESISSWACRNHDAVDPKLRHFLANASFAKALAHAEALTAPRPD